MNEGDFDKFLADAQKDEQSRNEIRQNLTTAVRILRETTPTRVYDADPETQKQLMGKYALRRFQYFSESPEEAGIDVPEGEELQPELLEKLANIETKGRVEIERLIVGNVAILMSLEQKGVEQEQLTDMKKRFVAGIVTDGIVTLNDPIMRYFMDAAPGENLDPNDEEDQHYFVDALVETSEDSEEEEKYDLAINEIWALLRQWTDKDPSDLYDVACEMSMAALYGRGVLVSERSAYQREEYIVQHCRKNGISQLLGGAGDQSLVGAITNVIQRHFPLEATA